MSFDWSGYLHLANELAAQKSKQPSSQEAKLRSSASRAYYSIFIQARNFLRDKEGVVFVRDNNVHLTVQKRFRRNQDWRRKRIGRILAQLRQMRNVADYDDQIALDLADEIETVLELAKEATALLKKL